MIVEDEEAIRETLKVSLELEGYETVTASNGLEALNWLKTHEKKPDLILLDLMMPVMDGWDFDFAMDEVPNAGKIPVVVVTACSRNIDSIRHSKTTLHKPVSLDLLLGAVAKYCPK